MTKKDNSNNIKLKSNSPNGANQVVNNKIKKSASGNLKKSSTSEGKLSNNSNIYNDDIQIEFTKDDVPFSKQTLNNLGLLLNNPTTRRIFIQFSEKEHSHNHVLFWQETKEYKEKFIEINQEQLSTQPEQQQIPMNTTSSSTSSSSNQSSQQQLMNLMNDNNNNNNNTTTTTTTTTAATTNNNTSNKSSPAMPSITPNTIASDHAMSVESSSPTSASMTVELKNHKGGDGNNSPNNSTTPRIKSQNSSINDDCASSSSSSSSKHNKESTSPSSFRRITSKRSQFLSGNRVSREATPDDNTDDDTENEIAMHQKSNLKNCLYIFDKYLTPSSELEVNLDFKTFIEIKKKIDQSQITIGIFEKSQKEIQEVIANDSYFRYKSSTTFRYLLTCAESFEKDNYSLIPSADENNKPKLKSRKSKFFCM